MHTHDQEEPNHQLHAQGNPSATAHHEVSHQNTRETRAIAPYEEPLFSDCWS